jgi:hypothetical protein
MSIKFNSAVTKLKGAAPWTLANVVVGSRPVYLYAYGMGTGDKVCVRRIVTGGDETGFTSTGCATNQPVPGAVVARSGVNSCGNPVCMDKFSASIQLREPGDYELVGEGPGFAAGTVIIEEMTWTGEHSPTACPEPIDIASLPDLVVSELPNLKIAEWPALIIESLPELKIANHVVDTQVVCGELWYIWSDGTKTTEALPECPPEFCASIPLNGGGFGYHEFDVRDPAATVIIEPCVGDTTVDKIYIYPSAGPGHTARQDDCDGVLIGYGANTSACAVTPAPAPSC